MLSEKQASKKTLSWILIFMLAILIVFSAIHDHYREKVLSEVQSLSEVEVEGHLSSGIRVYTNPPENITQIVSKSWHLEGTRMIGNTSYVTKGQEIRLTIYAFNETTTPNKDYILAMQKASSIKNNSYLMGGVDILHINSSAENSPPLEMDIFQKDNEIYVLRYESDSKVFSKEILQVAIEGLEL